MLAGIESDSDLGKHANKYPSTPQVEPFIDAFEKECALKQAPRMEEYLKDLPPDQFALGLYWMLLEELDCRVKNGDTVTQLDYEERFPNHKSVIAHAFDDLVDDRP